MNVLNRAMSALVMCALPTVCAAQTAQRKCITNAEFRSAAAVLLPTLLDSVMRSCAKSLPASSYLASKGPAMVERYRAYGKTNAPAFEKMLKEVAPVDSMKGMNGEEVVALADAFLGEAIEKDIKSEDCPDISTALAYLDPLPPENMIGLVDFVVMKIDQSEQRKQARLKNGVTVKRTTSFLCTPPTLAEVKK